MSHCWTRGAEIIVGDKSHIFLYEQGGAATLGGVHTHAVKNLNDGTFSLENLQSAIRSDDIHHPITSLVCIENTHNIMGGKVLPLAWLDELGRITKKLGLPVHLDGARLLNAAVALKVPPARLTRDCASVSLCLSKGLGAPVGSLICGSKDFIQRALRLRKVLGGGMRQSGILAAAGSLALARYQATLSMDNENAKIIAKRVSESASKKVTVDVEGVHSNIVMLNCLTEELGPAALQEKLEQVDLPHDAVSVRSMAINESQVRIVTNNSVDTEAIVLACEKIIKVIT
ncbi:hypothetical protein HAZT_HAZT002350 [Hyalella azteca]|uniref:Aromatic amino acid beta-eliminating lyase/threonine aldolase domain-containing protein n=2 Tax=Hyalella azteca TaxID=294128 RepID=A0A6A0H4X3_HYAAZ|nr:hypothetical protein HAZT_HAZT002350 [Hyalella azteca]